jgi:hypothetical protein
MLLFSSEIETKVTAEQGRIWIEQRFPDGDVSIIELTVRQFIAIADQCESIVDAAVSKLP